MTQPKILWEVSPFWQSFAGSLEHFRLPENDGFLSPELIFRFHVKLQGCKQQFECCQEKTFELFCVKEMFKVDVDLTVSHGI